MLLNVKTKSVVLQLKIFGIKTWHNTISTIIIIIIKSLVKYGGDVIIANVWC